MNLTGRRESTNVDDRRRSSAVKKGGLGIGVGGIVVALIVLFMGGDPQEALQLAQTNQTVASNYEPTAEEEELATFAKQILAGTEDVWSAEFRKMGRKYVPPKLVLFHGSVQSGCGGATA